MVNLPREFQIVDFGLATRCAMHSHLHLVVDGVGAGLSVSSLSSLSNALTTLLKLVPRDGRSEAVSCSLNDSSDAVSRSTTSTSSEGGNHDADQSAIAGARGISPCIGSLLPETAAASALSASLGSSKLRSWSCTGVSGGVRSYPKPLVAGGLSERL